MAMLKLANRPRLAGPGARGKGMRDEIGGIGMVGLGCMGRLRTRAYRTLFHPYLECSLMPRLVTADDRGPGGPEA